MPRRNDWSGERPGEAGVAQRKWMREHPRWPSSSCVAAHFGSWSAALDAAGLPVRKLTFETSVADRVHTAAPAGRRGHDRSRDRPIARCLAVERPQLPSGPALPGCGGPVTNPSAERCAACAASRPTVSRVWTRAEVRTAIRDWRPSTGARPRTVTGRPLARDPGRWEAESPRWPSAAVVCDLYADAA